MSIGTEERQAEAIRQLLEEIKASEKITLITGAGVSVASGIAPFRKSPDAVWERDVTERGTLRYFLEHPIDSWQWYHQRFSSIANTLPNPTHYAIADLEAWCHGAGIDFTLITQNVDRLHHRAGSQQLIEIHGRSDRSRCINHQCEFGAPSGSLSNTELNLEFFLASPSSTTLPRCPSCEDLIRPHILWFDEMYDGHQDYRYREAIEALYAADVIIAIGTSFSVGITELALYSAEQSGAAIWGVDIAQDEEIPVTHWLLGRAEEVTPRLIDRLQDSKMN